MYERSGGRMTAPQIFVGDFHVGGYDDLVALESRGALDALLASVRYETDTATGTADGGRSDNHDRKAAESGRQETDLGDTDHRSVIILGSGCAGLTAAIYTARASLAPLVITGREYGGQLYTTTDVENYPGFPEGIQGPELIDRMKAQAERFGATFELGHASALGLDGPPFRVVVDDAKAFTCDALIIATGASPKELGVPNERELRGYGVSTCATCDAAFFKGGEVAVVGGGDSAMEESLFLTKFASKVYLLHRRDEFRASKIMQDRVLANETIEVLWNTEVLEFLGTPESGLTGLRIVDNRSGDERELRVDGCFTAIGHDPNTDLLKGSEIGFDALGYVKAGDRPLPWTAVDGVFVAGDVHDHHYRQAVTAAGYGCRAALDVEKWLAARAEPVAEAETAG